MGLMLIAAVFFNCLDKFATARLYDCRFPLYEAREIDFGNRVNTYR